MTTQPSGMAHTRSVDLIEAYLTYLRMLGRSPRTIATRKYVLNRMDRELPFGLDQAYEDELAAWLYRDDWSAQTKASHLAAIKGFYRYHVGRALETDPSMELVRPHVPQGVPRPVTDAQLARILADAPDDIYLWCILAAYEGARCIEISRLSREDITERVTYLHGKGDKRRAIPTHPIVWTIVQSLPDGPIAMLKAQQISNRISTYCARVLGMRGVSAHRLRHWYLTNTHRASKDIRVTQQLAGHASPATTAIYTQVASVDMSAAVMALPQLSGGRLPVSAESSVPVPELAHAR